MLDTDTFLTQLYVMCDDFCKTALPPEVHPGPTAALWRAEVLTLSIFSQWRHFASERDFYRWAQRHLRPAFPHLPHRSQFNRQVRQHYPSLVAFWQQLTRQLQPADTSLYYQALDATAVPTRYVRRRGGGWLGGQADIGLGSRVGWYEGFYLLAATDPHGVFTGWGVAPASCKDQPLASTFLQARATAEPRLPTVGEAVPEGSFYLTDSGFQGAALHRQWRQHWQAEVLTPPQRTGGPGQRPWEVPWRKGVRRWIASLRQIIETAFGKLHYVFRLRDERPHCLEGFLTRLAAKMTLHNFCIYLNRQLGRSDLAFADLWSW
jgi:hypothetical protein